MSDYWSHLQSYSRTYTNIDSDVDLYMIKHIIMAKLILCVDDISNCGPAYVTMCLINEVMYIITPGHKRRHLGQLDKIGL